MADPLGYPKRLRATHLPPQVKPFRYKVIAVGPVVGIDDVSPDSEANIFVAPEYREINGRPPQSEEEWNLYKALLMGGVPKGAIEYQVPWGGGRILGGQVLDFVLNLGGNPIVIRVQSPWWHGRTQTRALDVFTGTELVEQGYVVHDISTYWLQSPEEAFDYLKKIRVI